jgi:serine/threonine protein kinase
MGMELLGCDLEKKMNSKLITPEIVKSEIAPAFINILKSIHERGVLHRDIKPQNMIVGVNDHGYKLVDFGLSKKYLTSSNNHIPFKSGKRLTGTPRFASRHVHAGLESSRRDDLESLGYVFVYLCKNGKLPWMKSVSSEKIASVKRVITVDVLCKDIPDAFKYYMKHVNNLQFSERPNYELLLSFFE